MVAAARIGAGESTGWGGGSGGSRVWIGFREGGGLGGRHFLGLCGASVEVGRGAAGEGRVLMASTRSMVSMGCDCCAL